MGLAGQDATLEGCFVAQRLCHAVHISVLFYAALPHVGGVAIPKSKVCLGRYESKLCKKF